MKGGREERNNPSGKKMRLQKETKKQKQKETNKKCREGCKKRKGEIEEDEREAEEKENREGIHIEEGNLTRKRERHRVLRLG